MGHKADPVKRASSSAADTAPVTSATGDGGVAQTSEQQVFGHAFSQVSVHAAPVVQKTPSRAKPAPVPKENLAVEIGDAAPDHESVIDQLTDIVVLSAGRPRYPAVLAFRDQWHEAAELILAPQLMRKPAPRSTFVGLHDPDLAAALEALTPAERIAVAAEVERRVVAVLQYRPTTDLMVEYRLLSPLVKQLLQGQFLGWVAMREAMFRCFVDIPQINSYYAALVPAEFPSTAVKGHDTLVHPLLKERLERARQLIKGSMPQVEAALAHRGLGATNIRENTARPSDIGSHAFGWAVDIEPGLNPDIRPFPDVFAEVTSTDAGVGPSVQALRRPGITTADAVTHARLLRRTSDEIVAAFANETSVVAAIAGYLGRHGVGTLDGDDRNALIALLRAAAAAKGPTDKAAGVAAVTAWVLAQQSAERARRSPSVVVDPMTRSSSTSQEDSVWVVTMAGSIGSPGRSEADLNARLLLIERQIDAPSTSPPKEARGLDLAPLYGRESVAALKAMNGSARVAALSGLRRYLERALQRTIADDTAARVLEIHEVFLGAERVRRDVPQDHGTAATVAAHGWMSLPPELVGALVGSEGAGLVWLGAMIGQGHGGPSGAKDSMHFELQSGDRPLLPAGRYPDVLRGGPAHPGGDFPDPGSADSA